MENNKQLINIKEGMTGKVTLSGVELIAIERLEQINKHGWSLSNDEDYVVGELISAAEFCLDQEFGSWPRNWTPFFRKKIENKSRYEQLIVAGAFIAAELDRLNALRDGKKEK